MAASHLSRLISDQFLRAVRPYAVRPCTVCSPASRLPRPTVPFPGCCRFVIEQRRRLLTLSRTLTFSLVP